IGKAFAENGARVVLTDLDESAVKSSALKLQQLGFEALGLKCNVTSEAEIIEVINETFTRYGRIDSLINNAGLQHVSPIEEFPKEKFELL
ncbi:SDR family NAD(P)-dependent oxidoreductase, partial [Streptococcus pyogenes]